MWSNDTVKASMTTEHVVHIFRAPTIPRTMDLEVDDGHNPRISMIYSVRLHTGLFLSQSCFQGCFRSWPGPMIVHPWFTLFPLHGTREKEKEKRKENTSFTMEYTRQAAFFTFLFPICPILHPRHTATSGLCPCIALSPLSHRPRVGFRVDPTFMDLDTNIILFGTAVRGLVVSLVIRKAGPCIVTGSTMVVRSDALKRKAKG